MKGKCEFADDCPVRRRRAQAKRLMRDPKRKGELGELVFVLTAASHGLIVSNPTATVLRMTFSSRLAGVFAGSR
jgi:hypothetical protein